MRCETNVKRILKAAAAEEDGPVKLIALDQPHRPEVEIGELLVVVVVYAANIVQDVRENIRNLVGGRMSHYEALIKPKQSSRASPIWRKRRRDRATKACWA